MSAATITDATDGVTVRGLGSGLAQEIVARGHRWMADEPATVAGGSDRGPNPYELLLAALGACTAITLRLYAGRKGWPLENVEVTLRHHRDHAEDCSDCVTKVGLVDAIELEVALHGPLDDEQRARLLEIAGRCPVHRTLENEIVIRERLR
jgi:putative redox protein